jgi:hypothetical protein
VKAACASATCESACGKVARHASVFGIVLLGEVNIAGGWRFSLLMELEQATAEAAPGALDCNGQIEFWVEAAV